ncbi:MAG: ATP-binding cassette domain-containing protein, partial [Bacteroidales bacterium]|nr:ATP-binding cassette domain-containing protein [Bacteroidales bacterium]
FKKKNRLYTKRQNKIYFLRDLAAPMTEFLSVIAVLPVILYGGIEVLQGEMSADIMVLFLLLFIRLIAPTKAVVTAFYNIQKGCAALERISEVVDSSNFHVTHHSRLGHVKYAPSPQRSRASKFEVLELPDDGTTLNNIITFNSTITFDNISFKYNGSDEYAIKNFSLTIPKGKTVALVGFSGAGKTTVADLIMRFYPLSEGKILIDGQDIQNINPESIRELFGYVSQMPFVWNDTIENNIRFGNTEAAFEEVVEAARKAKIHDFIISLPKGYQTITGDAGARISGGERQRIVIARAILRNAPILILDEATSSLDNIAEKQVQEALSVLMKDRTSIVIAHRLSTIVDADIIAVMEKGRIVQTGTHRELIEQKGVYATLFSGQWNS